ncbi:MAG: hypothetical protein L0Z54_00375 [Thermoplasmata archaeon]|nr:hypothetical protein [Thermoplasmata archaeon]
MVDTLDLACFSEIEVGEPTIMKESVTARIRTVGDNGGSGDFDLHWRYAEPMREADLPLLRMAALTPVVNYGPFTRRIRTDFPLSEADTALVSDMIGNFGRDIFVNNVLTERQEFILPRYLEGIDTAGPDDVPDMATLVPSSVPPDEPISAAFDHNACGILSSSGKESLLTYGLLKELGADVHPVYVNESGGHWRTAMTAFRWHADNEPNVSRVWTNVDRFYTFMLDRMRIIRRDHRKVRSDAYPIRLCIFPVYIFLLLPLFSRRRIANLLMGNEFDDVRETPVFRGIEHSHGIHDQWQVFDLRMERWYAKRMPGMRQWSALRPITGLVVERILVNRYPELARLQRSCPSCHFEDGRLVQCGRCSKCLGILLYIAANGADPTLMGFRGSDVPKVAKRLVRTPYRLDPDEELHARYLAAARITGLDGESRPHVESIHLHPTMGDMSMVPTRFREPILDILEEYTEGYTTLDGGEWVPAARPTL